MVKWVKKFRAAYRVVDEVQDLLEMRDELEARLKKGDVDDKILATLEKDPVLKKAIDNIRDVVRALKDFRD